MAELECRWFKKPNPGLSHGPWAALRARITNDEALSAVLCLARLYLLFTAEKPEIASLFQDSDMMGGLELRLEMESPSGRLWVDYEQSIRDSWQSVDCLRSCGGMECVTGLVFSFDLNLVGSGTLSLLLPDGDLAIVEQAAAIAREHFEEVSILPPPATQAPRQPL